MKIYLAGLGWITDTPTGNRLRWSYPLEALDGSGGFLGLPETIIVERAWLDEDIPHQPEKVTTSTGTTISLPTAPYSWWKSHGDVVPSGFLPQKLTLSKPVQAARFTYRGPRGRLRVFDSATNTLVAERRVANGDLVVITAPDLDKFELLTMFGRFENLMTLDLFDDHGLKFEEIAVIRVFQTLDADFRTVTPRTTIPPTLDEGEWKELVEAAKNGQTSHPGDIIEGEPTPWEAFGMVTGLRWEHALLFGHAFFDGPRAQWPEIDDLNRKMILEKMPPTAAVYRVREEKKRVGASNLVVCPPWPAAELHPPIQPTYEQPEVRLTTDPDTGRIFFEATYGMRWQQTAPDALGVIIEEKTSDSPTAGNGPEVDAMESRTRRPDEIPGHGSLARCREVPFHDVKISYRVCAVDGWDRRSSFGAPTPWAGLKLIHEPPPPALSVARHDAGTTRLTRQVGDPTVPDWRPDWVIRDDPSARVRVYRQKSGSAGQPRLEAVTVSHPVWVEGNRYRTTVSGAGSLTDFMGGMLVAPPFKAEVTEVSANNLHFEIGDGSSSLFSAGIAELHQAPTHPNLWVHVADFDPNNLPAELTFADPVPGPDGISDTMGYHLRVFCMGRLGPAGNTVRAVRIPATPIVPPPFTVETLGVDFYNRTLVKLCFTNPVGSGHYTIWWADGALSPSQFESRAVPGEQRAQSPYQNHYLFDSLSLPLPQSADRTITVGVQQVNAGEGQSGFMIAQLTLPAALAP